MSVLTEDQEPQVSTTEEILHTEKEGIPEAGGIDENAAAKRVHKIVAD